MMAIYNQIIYFMDNTQEIVNLAGFEDETVEYIDNIPTKILESIIKKQQTIHDIDSPTRHNGKQDNRYSGNQAERHSLRSIGLNQRDSDTTSFYSLESERQSDSVSPQKGNSLDHKHQQHMKDIYYKEDKHWENSLEREKTFNQLHNIFLNLLDELTKVKVGLMQLDEVQLEENTKISLISSTGSKQKNRFDEEGDEVEVEERTTRKIVAPNQMFYEFIQSYHHDMCKYAKTVKVREIQIGSVEFLFESHHKHIDIGEYNQIYGSLEKLIIPCSCVDDWDDIKINFVSVQEVVSTQIDNLREYQQVIQAMMMNLVNKKYKKDLNSLKKIMNKMKILNARLVTIAEVFPHACTLDSHDLFSLPKTHHRWKNLLKNSIRYKLYGESEKIRESFETHKSGINLLNATMSIIHQSKDHWFTEKKNWGKLAESTAKIVKCALNKTDADHEAQVLFSDPNQALTKQIWNLPDQKIFRNVINGILPSISFSNEYWVPKLFEDYLKLEGKIPIPNVNIDNIGQYLEKSRSGCETTKIQIRINAPFPLLRKDEEFGNNENKGFLSGIKSYFKKNPKVPEHIIFHVHGGGFISMSSFIHQTYTRIWSKNLDVPVISVDYGKAPQHPYPQGLRDCFEGYMWTLYCFRQIYEVEPVRIVMVGDSAGANLVLALLNLLMLYKLRKPEGIVLVYPVLNLSLQQYSPSLTNALNDFMLPHTLLKLCMKAYLINTPDIDPKDYHLSPLFTPNNYLKEYPKTRIFVGSKDPFHDDACRFTEKMNQLNPGRAKLTIFDEFPHGFLQFDLKTQPHEACRKATKEVENALKQLLECPDV